MTSNKIYIKLKTLLLLLFVLLSFKYIILTENITSSVLTSSGLFIVIQLPLIAIK